MDYPNHFWMASVDELKSGYIYDKKNRSYACLICGKSFEKGIVYPFETTFCSAKKAVEFHMEEEHASVFDFFLEMGKVYTGLTEHQKELMKLFYEGYTDKEIVERTSAASTSTIRNQRFTLREKYKQAKIIVAMTELLEERRNKLKTDNPYTDETLVNIHRTATMIDERYAITQAEKEDVLSRYFDKDNQLVIKDFPARQKKKIIILQHLIRDFEPNRLYTEKEVNAVIQKYYEDIPTIRRYLIQYGFLDRKTDGESYWVKQ